MKLITANHPTFKNLDHLFENIFGREMNHFIGNDTVLNHPKVNILESEDDFSIELAAPGFDKKDFKLSVENDLLTVSSEKEIDKVEEGKNFKRKEFAYSSFKRNFNLPESVDSENINAAYKNGILTLTLPKKEEAKPLPARNIKVS